MKLVNLNLLSYGKFKEKSIPLTDGLNIIAGTNEAGKSTVMAFIRSMLFGFGDNRKKSGEKSDRTRYTPWSGEKIAGEITFTHEGKTYQIRRSAGKTKASDSLSVIDLETGSPVDWDPERYLSIGEEGYVSTAYIRQLGSAFQKNDEVTNRLINLSSSGSEDVSIKKSHEILDDMYRVLKHQRGTGGKIDQTREEIFLLRQKLEESKNRHEQEVLWEQEKKESEARLTEIRPQLEALTQKLGEREKNVLYKEYRALLAEEERKKERVQAATADEEQEQELTKDLLVFCDASPCPFGTPEDTEPIEWELRKAEGEQKSTGILFLFSIVVTVLSVIGGIFIRPLFAGIVLGILFLLYGFYKKQKSTEKIALLEARLLEKQEKNRARAEFLQGFGCETVEEYNEKRSRYGISKGKTELLRKQTQNARAEWDDVRVRAEEKKAEIEERFGMVEDYVPTESTGDVLGEKEALESEQLHLRERVATLSAYLSDDAMRRPAEIRAEIEELEKKLSGYEKNRKALEIARKALTDAHEELSRDFAPRVNRRASEILAALTGGKHTELLMTKDYGVELRDREMYEVDYFSNGTADQVYFALRLAISELIFEGKEVPIILDDPFTQYDEKREKEAMAFLREYAKENQVILFTARPSEEPTVTL